MRAAVVCAKVDGPGACRGVVWQGRMWRVASHEAVTRHHTPGRWRYHRLRMPAPSPAGKNHMVLKAVYIEIGSTSASNGLRVCGELQGGQQATSHWSVRYATASFI